jgi:hypothetical protein
MSSKIKLKTQHLYIESDLAQMAFRDASQVYVVYYPFKKSLLLAPMSDEFFPKLHKAHLQMLKTRNLQGDKTVSLQEIIIDNDIDDSERDLEYDYTEGVNFLNIKI